MSRIDELIRELCPHGVPFRLLGEVAEYSRTRVAAETLGPSSFTGVDNLQAERGGRVDSSHVPRTGQVTGYSNGDVLIGNIRPYLKKIWLATSEGGCSGDVLAVAIRPEATATLCPEYLYQALASDMFFDYNSRTSKGAAMPRGDKAAILRYRIPVPPVEVQREIVRVLDLFQSLEAELEAELEARTLQYAHYRDALTATSDSIEKTLPIGQVAKVVRGASPRPIQQFITQDPRGVPWIKIGDTATGDKYVTSTTERITPEGAAKSRLVRPGDFILSNSMSFGRPYIVGIEGCIHDGWLAISDFQSSFEPDYLYHLLRSQPIQLEFRRRASSGGAVSNLNSEIVRSVKVPVPSLSDQRRALLVLDKFDALVNDLSSGLPAELAARRQQYAHYRDRLLTFREVA